MICSACRGVFSSRRVVNRSWSWLDKDMQHSTLLNNNVGALRGRIGGKHHRKKKSPCRILTHVPMIRNWTVPIPRILVGDGWPMFRINSEQISTDVCVCIQPWNLYSWALGKGNKIGDCISLRYQGCQRALWIKWFTIKFNDLCLHIQPPGSGPCRSSALFSSWFYFYLFIWWSVKAEGSLISSAPSTRWFKAFTRERNQVATLRKYAYVRPLTGCVGLNSPHWH